MLRVKQIFLIFLSLFSISIILHHKYFCSNCTYRLKSYSEKSSFLLNLPTCKIPLLGAKENSISYYFNIIKGEDLLSCKSKPPLTILEYSGLGKWRIRLDRMVLEEHYGGIINFTECHAKSIIRLTDNYNKYGYQVTFHDTFAITNQKYSFTKIDCVDNQGSEIYQNIHAAPVINLKDQNFRSELTADFMGRPKMNVLLIGLDSTSRLNFIRGMPKTRKLLDSRRPNGAIMEGYIKLGDNTYPNLVPLLLGKLAHEVTNDFDSHEEIIWKIYEKLGYYTILQEDTPEFAIFNFGLDGFYSQPTNFYYRPYALEWYKFANKSGCLRDRHEVTELFETSYRVLTSLQDTSPQPLPHFSFVFTTKLTHEHVNNIRHMDDMVYNYFNNLFLEGQASNTFIVIFGDHGIRYGSYRRNIYAMQEDKMPLLYIMPPPNFETNYPDMAQALNLNIKRMSTPLDLYATLIHLATLSATSSQIDALKDYCQRGSSLLKPVSKNRTCSSLGIPHPFCPCNVVGKLSSTQDQRALIIKPAALAIINKMNNYLSDYSSCSNLNLDSIIDVRFIDPDWNDTYNNAYSNPNYLNVDGSLKWNHMTFHYDTKIRHKIQLILVIKTVPSNAYFEALIAHNNFTDQHDQVLGDVLRLSEYEGNSLCVNGNHLRRYCYCK